MTSFPTPLNRKNRLVSMLLDHAIMCFVLVAFMAPSMIYKSIHLPGSDYPAPLSLFQYNAYEVFAFSLYFNKDIYLGQSPAKRILKFQVFDVRTNSPANALQCLIRNLTILIWPVEVVVAFFNKERRLGDYLAGTRVGMYESGAWAHAGPADGGPESKLATRPNWGLMIIAILLGSLYTWLTMVYGINLLFRWMEGIH